MIQVKSQSDLDNIVRSFPTNEMVRVYALPNGDTYKLSETISIPRDGYIKGVNNPIIEWTSSIGKAMISVEGQSVNENETITNVVIDGLVLRGRAVSSGVLYGVKVLNSGYTFDTASTSYQLSSLYGSLHVGTTIKNCIIEDVYEGITIEKSALCKVANCTIKKSVGNSMYINDCKHITLIKNIIEDGATGNIQAIRLTRSIIKDNLIKNCKGCVDLSVYNNYIIITGNTMVNCGGGLNMVGTSNCTVHKNTIVNCGSSIIRGGITLNQGSWRNAITSNVVTNCSGDGILIDEYCERNSIVDNIVQFNQGVGLKQNAYTNPYGIKQFNHYTLWFDNISTKNSEGNISIGTSTGSINQINMTTNI